MYGKELSDRKKMILKTIIEAHITEGDPVGSKYILENTALTCSSATIRNEMAELEALGYLEQPHTSAGRIPSVSGYRFYVDYLMNRYAMTQYEIAQINGVLKNKLLEVDSILELASKVASNLTNYTGIALKPSRSALTITRYEVVCIDEMSFILIMMLSSTEVKSRRFTASDRFTPDMAERISLALNKNLTNVTADEITLSAMMKTESDAGDDCQADINVIVRYICKSLGEGNSANVRLSGLNHFLEYPEYSDSEKLRALLGKIESGGEDLSKLIDDNGEEAKVYIGSESTIEEMGNSALVFKPIRINGKTVGAIGVIGPLRMDYGKVLATIDSLTGNISDIMSGIREDDARSLPEKSESDNK
jgi:heat-inducible transcriptional repressor